MQLAIRRVLPTTRQQLSRPHRLGRLITSTRPTTTNTTTPRRPIPPSTTSCRCFTSSAQHLRHSDGDTPVEQPTTAAEPSTSSSEAVDDRESASKPSDPSAPPTTTTTTTTTTTPLPPGVRPAEHDGDPPAAEGSGSGVDGAGEQPEEKPRGRGRPKIVRRVKKVEVPKPVLPEWYLDERVLLREDLAVGVREREEELKQGWELLEEVERLKAEREKEEREREEREKEEDRVEEKGGVKEGEKEKDGKESEKTEEVVAKENPEEVTEKKRRRKRKKQETEESTDEAAKSEQKATGEEPVKAEEPEPIVAETKAEESVRDEEPQSTIPEDKPEEPVDPEEAKKKDLLKKLRFSYSLDGEVWQEIEAHIRTGWILPKGPFAGSMASRKAHCLLHLPKEGGVYFLDTLAEKLASDAGADLIRLDAQDLAEIGGDYLGDSTQKTPSDISPFELRSLGYDTQAQITETLDDAYAEEEEEAEDMSSEVYEEDEDAYTRGTRPPMVPGVYEAGVSLNTSEIGDAVRRLLGQSVLGAVVLNSSGRGSGMPVDVTNERKMALLLDSMISAGEIKRHKRSPPEETADSIEPPRVGKTLIHVRDYREIERTNSGQVVLKTLHNLVAARRQAGEQILILGTSSAEEEMETYSKTGIRALQTRSDDSFERTIVVPPRLEYLDSIVFEVERDSRVREVNIRHLRDVIRRRSGVECVNLIIPEDWHRGSHDPEVPGIAENIWNFDYVHRIASVALGRLESGTSLTISDVCDAIELIERSDTVKYEWAAKEYQRVKAKEETPDETAKDAAKDKLAKISKTATKHEKGLLSGVIDPASIKSGFSSIRAAPETIDAMKTLTTLSLIRPDAFKYGVLSSDRIPGVLLYGPPGTGKTLLAKAVAKESGATVLEVDGASITDMYVGESEKNVKAIFSLAKKLSPCVIFIDEADAVFGSRHSHTNRSSHRETINQFLKEWADMTSTAFIMVATNRPFDLDDAILRRLPRRILLDLPTPEDRLEILKLHLAEEILDADVDLKDIADNTPLYSGSDCKNLAVGAALNCVRDEIKEFEVSRKYPEKRVIRKKHFDAALKEISPSISDDMGTLTQIRKFDEKYGERAGHKKKVKSWGFELGQGHAQHRTESRVRMD